MSFSRTIFIHKLFVLAVSIIAASLFAPSTVFADITQDNNNGYLSIDLSNLVGLTPSLSELPPNASNLQFSSGRVVLNTAGSFTSGTFTTAEVRPPSFSAWTELEIDSITSFPADIEARIIECGTTNPVTGVPNPAPIVGGKVNLSGINKNTYPCIRAQITLRDNSGPAPSVDDLTFRWVPLPVFLSSITCPATKGVGTNITYDVRYSVSYVSSNGVIVWVPLPSGVTDAYGQDASATFVSATNGGLYTSTGITVRGINIPANSVYWDLGPEAEGSSSLLRFTVRSNNGVQNNTAWNYQAFVDSADAELAVSDSNPSLPGNQPCATNLTSTPTPKIRKEALGAVNLGTDRIVYNGSGYNGQVTYQIDIENTFGPTDKETIFDPIVRDDVSHIFSILRSSAAGGCNMASPASAFTNISSSGVLNSSTLGAEYIQWDFTNNHLSVGSTRTVSFTVDYSTCLSRPIADGTIVNNNVSLTADNINQISASRNVKFGLNLAPNGAYAKGEEIRGFRETRAGVNDNEIRFVNHGETFKYILYQTNAGPVNLYDNVYIDKIPAGLDLAAVSIASSYRATVFYATTNLFGDPNSPPAFTLSGTPGIAPSDHGVWSTTPPTSVNQTTWVAVYVPCLSSNIFPAAPGSLCDGVPSNVAADILVQAEIPGDACLESEANNIGHFRTYNASNTIANNDSGFVTTSLSYIDTAEKTKINPLLGELLEPTSNITGNDYVDSQSSATYRITINNTGSDTIVGATVRVNIPQILVNGVMQYISLASITGGSVDLSTLASGYVTVSLGDIPPGAAFIRHIDLSLTIPAGVIDGTTYSVGVLINGSDPEGCQTIASSLSKTTIINAEPRIEVIKSREQALIGSGGDIHYEIDFRNAGRSPLTNTYIVDEVPAKTVLGAAYTSPAVDAVGNVFSCVDCKVYFSTGHPDLPVSISPADQFQVSDITNYFVLGVEVDPLNLTTLQPGSGVWLPPASYANPSQIKFVAWKIDDSSLPQPLLATNTLGKVGMYVTNDDDGSGSGTSGSVDGTIIRNNAASMADQLLQTISNQVITTILPEPGLRLSKTSDQDIIGAGTPFTWSISYYNDSGSDDTEVILTDALPLGVNISGLTHEWNSQALANDPTLPAGQVNILANANVQVTPGPTGTTIRIVIADTDGSPTDGLRQSNLGFLEGGTIRIMATVDGTIVSSGTTLTNTVEGCYSNPLNSYCITASDLVTVQKPDLTVNKFVSRTDPLPGEIVTYTLIIANRGQLAAPNVNLVDILPAGVCFVGGSAQISPAHWSVTGPSESGGPCATSPSNLTWSNFVTTVPPGTPAGTIPANSENITISYRGQVQAGVAPGTTLTNSVAISTSIPEDNNFPNNDTQDTRTPLPDPYISKAGPLSVLPGQAFNYTLQYGNLSRIAATGVYFIDRLPDIGDDGTANITLASIAATHGEVIYCHDATTGEPAVGDLSPATLNMNGWVTQPGCFTPGYKPTYILAVIGSLAGNAGPFSITIGVEARDQMTGIALPAASTIVNNVRIGATVDDNSSNNNSSATSRTPGFDLFITKTGSIEGSFPGTIPGAALSYTMTYGNSGTERICNVAITDTLPAGLDLAGSGHNFSTISLVDSAGNPMAAVDPAGLPISDAIPVVFNNSSGNLTWTLGNPSSGVCLPPGSRGTFEVYVSIDSNVADSTSIENCAHIDQSAVPVGNEDIRSNNDDCSSVSVYRSDVTSSKTGYACGPDDDCSTAIPGGGEDNNSSEVNAGEKIRYTVNYNNSGNTAAEGVTIVEQIPTGSCYVIGSAEVNQPAGTTLEFSSDGGSTWSYVPVGAAGTTDCLVTNFRLLFTTGLPAPATFWSQSTAAEFSTGTLTGVRAQNGSDNLGEVVLQSESRRLSNHSLTTAHSSNPDYESAHAMKILTGADGVSKFAWVEATEASTGNELAVYFWRDGMGAGGAQQVAPSANFIPESDIRAFTDANSKAHIIWIQESGTGESADVYYWNEDMPFGSPQRISDLTLTEGWVRKLTATIDANGTVHALWDELNSDSAEFTDAFYWNSQSGITTLVSNHGITRGYASALNLAVTPSGIAHIAFKEHTTGTELGGLFSDTFYWNSTMAAGTAINISDPTNTGMSASVILLKLDALDRAHVAWSEHMAGEHYNMFYYRSDFGASPGVDITDASVTDGLIDNCEMVISTTNNAHIYWAEKLNGTGHTDLFFWSSSSLPSLAATRVSDTAAGSQSIFQIEVIADLVGRSHISFIEGNNDVYYWNSSQAANSPTLISNATSTSGFARLLTDRRSGESSMILNPVSNTPWITFEKNNSTPVESLDRFYWDSSTPAPATRITNLVDTQGETSQFGSAARSPSGKFQTTWGEFSATAGESTDIYFWDTDIAVASPYLLTSRSNSQGVSKISGYGGLIHYDASGQPVISWGEENSSGQFEVYRWEGSLGASSGQQISLTAETDPTADATFEEFSKRTPDGCVYTIWKQNANTALYPSEGSDVFAYPFNVLNGTIRSPLIANTSGGNLLAWGNLIVSTELPPGSNITYSVYDSTGTVIPGFNNLTTTSGIISLAAIPVTAPSNQLYIEATMTPGPGCATTVTPKLKSWQVTYTTDSQPNFTFDVRVFDSGLSVNSIRNVVCISTETPETNANNNCGQHTLPIRMADIRIEKSVDRGATLPGSGDTLTYTIDYCNDGPSTADNPIIADTIPDFFVLNVGSLPVGCSTNVSGFTCMRSSLAPGECGQITFNGTLSGAAVGGELLRNAVCISSDTFDPDQSDNCDTADTRVGTLANVYIQKTGPSTVNLNQEFEYFISYGNNGNTDANDVYIVDNYDATRLTFVSAVQLSGSPALTCSESPIGTVTCSADGTTAGGVVLPAGQTGTIALRVRVNNDPQILIDSANGTYIDNIVQISTTTAQTSLTDDADDHQVRPTLSTLASLSGSVFVDRDSDVIFDSGTDTGINNVPVFLYGFDIFGRVYGPDSNIYAAQYTSAMTEILPVLISNGIVPGGTTLSSLPTLANYVALAPVITNSSGDYSFSGLYPALPSFNGSFYNVMESQPLGYRSTGSNGGQIGLTANDSSTASLGHGLGSKEGGSDVNRIRNIELAEGTNSIRNDFGEALGQIGNLVFADTDRDGVKDLAEVGIGNVEVSLYQDTDPSDGAFNPAIDILISQTYTDTNGAYLFADLRLDDDGGDSNFNYFVVVTDSAGVLTGAINTLGTPGVDNNSQNATGYSITLDSSNFSNLTGDFGYVYPASLGDTVWYDTNGDGLQGADEPGVAGVTVNLYLSDNTLFGTTITDGNGHYEFLNLAPGDYYVEFIPPTTGAYQFSVKDQASNSLDAFDSDADTSTGRTEVITLAVGESNRTIDAGLSIPNILPASIGNYVWYDTDGNGQQDTGETGVAGVTVRLLDSLGNQIAQVLTDGNGFYQFGGLAPGDYIIDFVPTASYNFTAQDNGADDSDSDADASTGETALISLAAGDHNETVDAGLILSGGLNPASIGNYVWYDTNQNGQQDVGETGIAGVTVRLYNGSGTLISETITNADGEYYFGNLAPGDYSLEFIPSNSLYVFTFADFGGDDMRDSDASSITGRTATINLSSGEDDTTVDAGMYLSSGAPASIGDRVFRDVNSNGIQDGSDSNLSGVTVNLYDSNGNLISTTQTDASGLYLFENLAPGTYYVGVIPPSGLGFTFDNIGSDDSVDSDIDRTTGRSPAITLASGENRRDVDAGLSSPVGTIGNQIFRDLDADGVYEPGAGESGFESVKVSLYWDINRNGVLDAGDQLIDETFSGSDGRYQFVDLPIDDGSSAFHYIVAVEQPAGFVSTLGTPGVDNNSQIYTGYHVILNSGSPEVVYADFGFTSSSGTCASADIDGDGIPNSTDVDIDGDGILNTLEIDQANTLLGGNLDLDSDGRVNHLDLDSDGDGITDRREAQVSSPYLAPSGVDANSDGMDDVYATGLTPIDTDSDGRPDYLDADSDNDGLNDNVEYLDPAQYIPPSGIDANCDGHDDAYVIDRGPYGGCSGIPDFREAIDSCPDVNVVNLQFSVDHSAAILDQYINQLLRLRQTTRSGSVRGRGCKKLSASQVKNYRARSRGFYTRFWNATWSLPGRSSQVSDPDNTSCPRYETAPALTEMSTTAAGLKNLARTIANGCKNNSKARSIRTKVDARYSSMTTVINGLPNPMFVCPR